MVTVLHEVSSIGADRMCLANDDPEAGHGLIDEMTERVVRAVAAGEPDAKAAAQFVVAVLDREKKHGWTRWYA